MTLADTGTVTGVTGGFSAIDNLTGGSGNDSFAIASLATLSGTITGGNGSDTLSQADGTNTWSITSTGTGTVTDVSIGFSGIENLTGGGQADTFNVLVAHTGDLSGGGGNYVFALNGNALTGAVAGGAVSEGDATGGNRTLGRG